jgi:hypothetical protein
MKIAEVDPLFRLLFSMDKFMYLLRQKKIGAISSQTHLVTLFVGCHSVGQTCLAVKPDKWSKK